MRRRHIISSVLGWVAALSTPIVHSAESLAQTSASTKPVAERYFSAYIGRDWETLAPLLAEAGSFVDPTAEPVFGKVEHRGKLAVMKNFREGYAAIKHMEFAPSRTVFSGAYAIFEGTLDWTLKLDGGAEAITKSMPFITILRVQSGVVVEHTDYADYQPFIEAVRRAKTKA